MSPFYPPFPEIERKQVRIGSVGPFLYDPNAAYSDEMNLDPQRAVDAEGPIRAMNFLVGSDESAVATASDIAYLTNRVRSLENRVAALEAAKPPAP